MVNSPPWRVARCVTLGLCHTRVRCHRPDVEVAQNNLFLPTSGACLLTQTPSETSFYLHLELHRVVRFAKALEIDILRRCSNGATRSSVDSIVRVRHHTAPATPAILKCRRARKRTRAALHELAHLLHQREPSLQRLRPRHEGGIEEELVRSDLTAARDIFLDLLDAPGEDCALLP